MLELDLNTNTASTILIIDDSILNIQVAAGFLEAENYRILSALNGAQGVAIALAKLPSLILLDVMMPAMDGFMVCEKLKENPLTCDIPVIFLSAAHETDFITRGFRCGAVDYITKPFKKEELIMRVRTHLDLYLSRAQISAQKKILNLAIDAGKIGIWRWVLADEELILPQEMAENLGLVFNPDSQQLFQNIHAIDDKENQAIKKAYQKMMDSNESFFQFEFQQSQSDPMKKIWFLVRGEISKFDDKGKPLEILGTLIDISIFKEQEEKLRLLSHAIQESANSVIITDPDGQIVFINHHFLLRSGYSLLETLGQTPRLVKSGQHSAEFYHDLWDTILAGNVWRGEFMNKAKNGEIYWESSTITPLRDETGKIQYFIAIQEDITEKVKLRDQLVYHSTIDEFSGAYNRRTGLEMLKQQLSLAKRKQYDLHIVFIDLNDLKYVNDTFGHAMGDQYIKAVTDIIHQNLRQSDLFIRLGGDEFLLVLPECDHSHALGVMERIQQRLTQQTETSELPFPVSFSYGLVKYDYAIDESLAGFIARADKMMYVQKQEYKKQKRLLRSDG